MKTFANRQIAIQKTLVIEDLTSKLLKHMIGLELHQNTKALDNKSSSISLRAKIDLLTDCGKIDKITYVNLLHIISIRNQFAHNFECNYFEDLPKYIDGIERPLLKFCLEPTESREEDLKSGFLNMLEQAFEFLLNEFTGVTKEYQIDAEKLKVSISQVEEGLLNQWGITGPRNRAIVLNKLREFMKEEDREQTNERIESKIINFINENPDLK